MRGDVAGDERDHGDEDGHGRPRRRIGRLHIEQLRLEQPRQAERSAEASAIEDRSCSRVLKSERGDILETAE